MPASRPAPALLPRPKHLPIVGRASGHASAARPAAHAIPQPAQIVSIGLEAVPCAHALKRELGALGIVDADVAAALGVSRGEAGKLLAGVRQLYLAHLRRLARRLPAARPAIAAALASIVGGA